jgi:hypothetical protein
MKMGSAEKGGKSETALLALWRYREWLTWILRSYGVLFARRFHLCSCAHGDRTDRETRKITFLNGLHSFSRERISPEPAGSDKLFHLGIHDLKIFSDDGTPKPAASLLKSILRGANSHTEHIQSPLERLDWESTLKRPASVNRLTVDVTRVMSFSESRCGSGRRHSRNRQNSDDAPLPRSNSEDIVVDCSDDDTEITV